MLSASGESDRTQRVLPPPRRSPQPTGIAAATEPCRIASDGLDLLNRFGRLVGWLDGPHHAGIRRV